MEDYHILRIINSMLEDKKKQQAAQKYPDLNKFAVTRIDCDPPSIDKKVSDDFVKWSRETRWKKEHYISAILWGLGGLKIGKINWAYANWSLASLSDEAIRNRHFYIAEKVLNEDGSYEDYVLCPFYTEVACDLLSEILKQKKKGNSDKGLKEDVFPGLIVNNCAALFSTAEKIIKNAAPLIQTDEKQLKTIIGEFVDKLMDMFRVNSLIEGDNLPIWARPGWKDYDYKKGDLAVVNVRRNSGSAESRLRTIWGNLSNGNLDRALYKSTNMIALQLKSATGIEGMGHSFAFRDVMSELKRVNPIDENTGLPKRSVFRAKAVQALEERLRGDKLMRALDQMIKQAIRPLYLDSGSR
jgi:hypothetical protein